MTENLPLCVFVLATLAASLAAAAAETAGEPEFVVTPSRWFGNADAAQTVHIINEYGDIRARSAGDEPLSIHAMIQKIGASQEDPAVDISECSGGVTARVVVPEGFSGRVDVAVLIPPDGELRLRSRDGLIEAKNTGSDVFAVSAGGDIRFTGSGHIDARSIDGNLALALNGDRWSRPQRGLSVTGAITVRLADTAALDIRATTEGSMTNTLPEDRVTALGDNQSGLHVRLGDGGPLLHITSLRGDISLHGPVR